MIMPLSYTSDNAVTVRVDLSAYVSPTCGTNRVTVTLCKAQAVSLPSAVKAVYLNEWELRSPGSWTAGSTPAAWDSGTDAPVGSFVQNGVTYNRLNVGPAGDSLYRREDAVAGYRYMRFNWTTAGRAYNDGTYNWTYLGTWYTVVSLPRLPDTWANEPSYKGPVFRDGNGVYWVMNRYGPYYTSHGTSYAQVGQLQIPFVTGSPTQAQADSNLGKLLNKFSVVENGGILFYNNTPTYYAMETAEAHFASRAGNDPAVACRKRIMIVLSDGQSNTGSWGPSHYPWNKAQEIYTRSRDAQGLFATACGGGACPTGNPIQTFAIGVPGMSSYGEMDEVADRGDDGIDNSSSISYHANNEKQLTDAIRAILFSALAGDYTTGASAQISSGGAGAVGDIAFFPSIGYPAWKGHLRKADLTKLTTDPAYIKWDAGTLLNARAWDDRDIFSGSSGNPFRMFTKGGGAGGINTTAITNAWPSGYTVPNSTQISNMVQWMAGNGAAWKLGGIVNVTPAVVGIPPKYTSTPGNHSNLEASQAQRTRMVYVPSNVGMLHAFDAKTGKEQFAYVPPALYPKLYDLFKAGGQTDDPSLYRYLMANSPRVEDLPGPGSGWSTYLAQTFGPGGDNFFVLDITDPTNPSSPANCTAPSDPNACDIRTPNPFTVVFSSGTSINSTYGETWSIPALFWDTSTGQAAMGSGYDVAISGEGSWYNFFGQANASWPTTGTFATYQKTPITGAYVDYGVLADTVAVQEPTGDKHVVATYQADLLGRVLRYNLGSTTPAPSVVINGGVGHPFFFSPAALHREATQPPIAGNVTLAVASGAYQSRDAYIAGPTPPSPPGSLMVSSMFMLTEDGAGGTSEVFTCPVNGLCGACYNGGNVGPLKDCTLAAGCGAPQTCSAPSARAQPVSSPVIINNKTTGQVEAFFLYYDPPAATCTGNAVSIGDTWLIRIGLTDGTKRELVEARRYSGMQGSGISIIGGGKDVGVVFGSRTGSPGIGAQGAVKNVLLTGNVVVEGWREVK
jgi:hypothetical protein